ncbi:MAG: serine/threonine protein kinase [Planctomycetota bacterium]|nr:MAG: serine/threonine protein kinase [Planctomycetota bacterium]
MDAAREHLWGQLLAEQRLVGTERLAALVAERDARIRGGQDCSLGQLLVQRRELDVERFQRLRNEIEGRGRACYRCRSAYLAPSPNSPQTCPRCGGPARLPPPSGGSFRTTSARQVQQVPSSGRYGTAPGSGPFPAHSQGTSVGSFVRPVDSGPRAVPGSARSPATSPPAPPGSWHPTGGRASPPPGSGHHSHVPPAPAFLAVGPNDSGRRVGSTASAPDEFELSDDFDSGELGVGKRFGPYEILGELGRGGMGVVYKAAPVGQPERVVAIKVLLAGEFASEKLKRRFKAESELAQRLDHPNIVPVFDVGEVDGLLYYAMGYVEGQELQDMIRSKSLPVRRGVEILVEVCHAAHHAHQHGVVHRDLKPSNVLVAKDGTPYIMDFGLAKNLEADQGMTKSGVAIGTPYYMPPEQARGNHRAMDARSDVYALGAILYEVITRRVPFTAKTQNELLRKIVEEEPVPPRQVRPSAPPELEAICLKCLCKEKEGRYATALELAEDLERYLAGEPVRARKPSPLTAWLRKIRRNRAQAAVVAGAALAVVGAVGLVAAIHSNYQAERRREEARLRKEEERRAKEEAEAERKRREEAARRRKREQLAQRAERAVTGGQDAYAQARAASTYSELLRALGRSEAAFDDAVAYEAKLRPDSKPRPATAYRRGLVRRLRCSWKGALEDFLLAARSKEHRARANLAAGLIQLRQYGDREAAEALFEKAEAAEGLGPLEETEEKAAEEIAQAYLAHLRGAHESARKRLKRFLRSSERGSFEAEAYGALAYFLRLEGKPLGDDEAAREGLEAANKAVRSDKFRQVFLVDRAILLARRGRRPDAFEDQRTARNLDVDDPWAELAEAVIHSQPRGDDERRVRALRQAKEKARRRGEHALREVESFIAALEGATRERKEREAQARTIAQNCSKTVRFNGGGRLHSFPFDLVVPEGTRAVLLTLSEATTDIDLYVSRGQPKNLNECELQANTPSPDETLLLAGRGSRPLRSGRYAVLVVQPPSSRAKTSVKLTVRYFGPDQEPPFVWERLPALLFTTQANATRAQALLRQLTAGDHQGWLRGWLELEAREPAAKIGRVNLLTVQERLPAGFASREDFARLAAELAAELAAPKGRLPRYPEHLLIATATAEVYAGKVAEGLGRLKRAMEQNPRVLAFRIRAIQLLNHLGRYTEAEELGRVVLKHPQAGETPVAHAAIAETAVARKQEDLATKLLLRAALSKAAPPPLALRCIERLVRLRRFADALNAIRTVDARTPTTVDVNLEVLRAYCIAGQGKVENARQRLQTLRARVPPGRKELTTVLDRGLAALADGSYLGRKTDPEASGDSERSEPQPVRKKRRRR